MSAIPNYEHKHGISCFFNGSCYTAYPQIRETAIQKIGEFLADENELSAVQYFNGYRYAQNAFTRLIDHYPPDSPLRKKWMARIERSLRIGPIDQILSPAEINHGEISVCQSDTLIGNLFVRAQNEELELARLLFARLSTEDQRRVVGWAASSPRSDIDQRQVTADIVLRKYIASGQELLKLSKEDPEIAKACSKFLSAGLRNSLIVHSVLQGREDVAAHLIENEKPFAPDFSNAALLATLSPAELEDFVTWAADKLPLDNLPSNETVREHYQDGLIRNAIRATLIDMAMWFGSAALIRAHAEETPDLSDVLTGMGVCFFLNILPRSVNAHLKFRGEDDSIERFGNIIRYSLSFATAYIFHTTFGTLMHELGHKYAAKLVYDLKDQKLVINPNGSGWVTSYAKNLSQVGDHLGANQSKLLLFAAGPIAQAASSILQWKASSWMPDQEHRRFFMMSAVIGYLHLINYSLQDIPTGDFAMMGECGFPHLASILTLMSAPVIAGCLSKFGLKQTTKWVKQGVHQAQSTLGKIAYCTAQKGKALCNRLWSWKNPPKRD